MKKVLVVGGGLVGSLIAIMMKKRGHSVKIIEKRLDMRKNENAAGRSINLVITSRGLYALEKAGLLKEVLPLTVPVTGRMIHTPTSPPAYQAYGRDPSECNYSVSRGDLNRHLLSACENSGVSIEFGISVETIDLQNKKVFFSRSGRSESESYDIMLGTDGAGSAMRKSLKKSLGNLLKDETEILPADYKELFMPLGPEGQPMLEKNALHIWPHGKHMMMALPNRDGSFTVTLYLPSGVSTKENLSRQSSSESPPGDQAHFASLKNRHEVEDFLFKNYGDAMKLMPHAIDDFMNNPQGQLGTLRCAPWTYGDSVVLLGDAAHAIVPFFGQGMNLGFEDCIYLDRFLTQHGDDWAAALSDFDSFQRPNANAIADMALENFVEMSDKVADAHFMLKKKIEAKLESHFPEIYRSRYGMITYTQIPYAIAQQAGQIQDSILEKLSRNLSRPEDLDLSQALRLLEEDFVPFLRANNLNLEKYRPLLN